MLRVEYKSITFGFKNGKEVKITNVNGIHTDNIRENREIKVYIFENGRSIEVYTDSVIYIIVEP